MGDGRGNGAEDRVRGDARSGARAGDADAGDRGSDFGAASGVSGEPSIDAIAAERDEMKDRMLRIAADFENWKKRARKEQTDAELRAREGVLKDMLEVMDNLERALGASAGQAAAAGGDVAPILKGIEMVLRIFQTKLDRYEVKPIEAKGKPFDPHLHEAISRVETADAPVGTVVAELQRGYRIGERLLRPAMVSVAAAPSAPADAREGGTA